VQAALGERNEDRFHMVNHDHLNFWKSYTVITIEVNVVGELQTYSQCWFVDIDEDRCIPCIAVAVESLQFHLHSEREREQLPFVNKDSALSRHDVYSNF